MWRTKKKESVTDPVSLAKPKTKKIKKKEPRSTNQFTPPQQGDVSLVGPFDRADIKKKKKKEISRDTGANLPSMRAKKKKHFEFKESHDTWCSIISEMKPVKETVNQKKLNKIWKELNISQRRDLLRKLKLDTKLADLDFKDFTDKNIDDLTSLDKSEFTNALTIVLSVGLAGLALGILDAPIDKPVDDIDPVNIKTDDRQPSFNQPSSFVGQVDYFPEDLSMEVRLNGKLYAFCDVPERKFDSWEGASSKGAFFNREIKTLHDC